MYTKFLDIIKTLQFSILTMQKLQLVICDTFHSVNVAQLTQVNLKCALNPQVIMYQQRNCGWQTCLSESPWPFQLAVNDVLAPLRSTSWSAH